MIKKNMTPLRKLMFFNGVCGGVLSEDTAIGNPLTFLTNVAKPLKSLLIPFTPVPEGSGDPSPENVRNIIPWNGLTVWNGGKNLLNPAWLNFEGESTTIHGITFTKNADGSFTANGENDGSSSQIYFTLTGNFVGDFWICDDMIDNAQIDIYCYNGTKAERVKKWDGTTASDALTRSRHAIQVKLNGEDNIRLMLRVYTGETVDNVKFRPYLVSSTETDFTYEQFVPITETDIAFPEAVYGGVLNPIRGTVTVQYGIVSLDTVRFYAVRSGFFASYANLPDYADRTKLMCNAYKVVSKMYWDDMQDCQIMGIPEGGIVRIKDESCEDVDALYAKLTETGAVLVYPLVTPITIGGLDKATINALKGANTIWSDANQDMTAVFLKKG